MSPDDSLQAAVEEAVAVQPYDPLWPEAFASERERLVAMLPYSFTCIEHIGSTAIPGMPAKPIIDILAGVASESDTAPLISSPRAFGYVDSVEIGSKVTDHRWFMRWADGHRTHHLHVVVHGSEMWLERIRLRDILRHNAGLAAQYASLKLQLAGHHTSDREAYTNGKSEFIRLAARAA